MGHANVDNEGMALFLTKNYVVFIHFTYVKKLVTLGYGKFFILCQSHGRAP